MRIVVTGGAGYLGDAVVEELLRRGHEIVLVDNLLYGDMYRRKSKRLTFLRADIMDAGRLTGLIAQSDGVVHLAAIVGDGACVVNPARTIEVNEMATGNIAALCAQYNIPIVFASTCSVFGANLEILNEGSPTNPLSIYAGTKLKAEELIRARQPNHFIFRCGTLFGLSTEHGRLRNDLVVNVLTYKACSGQKISVFGGAQYRPLLHVRDAAQFFSMAICGQINTPGTYIISSGNYTVMDIARAVSSLCDISNDMMEITEVRFEDLRNYKVDVSKANDAALIPYLSLENGITEMRDFFREGRVGNIWDSKFNNARYVELIYAK